MLLAALIIAAAAAWGAVQIARELKAARDEASSGRALEVVQLFAPALAAAHNDPRSMLVWQPLARTARQLFPAEFALIERAAGRAFPFTADELQAAHARWTADWLAWERTHDAEYKLRAATLEHELAASNQSPLARARLDAIEREKLDLYQKRYEEYIRVAKALQTLIS
jgi:hypothetical protein